MPDLTELFRQQTPGSPIEREILWGKVTEQFGSKWLKIDNQDAPIGPLIGADHVVKGDKAVIAVDQNSVPYIVYPPPPSGGGTYRGEWVWTLSITSGAVPGRVTVNGATWAASTQVHIAEVSGLGTDTANVLGRITPGDTIFLQDKDDAAKWAEFTVSSPGIDEGDWWRFPVTFVEGTGAFPANNQDTLVILKFGGGGGGGGGGTPGGVFYTTTFGNGSAKTFTITHGLGTKSVGVFVYRTAAPYDEVIAEVERTTDNTVTIRTLETPALNEYTVLVTSPGTPGEAGGYYVHTQTVPDDVWVVTHNMGRHPSVSVVDSGDTMVIPDVHYIDDNNLQVLFGTATSGKAYMN